MFRARMVGATTRLGTQLAGTILCFVGAYVVLSPLVSTSVGSEPAERLLTAPLFALFGLPYVVLPVLLVALGLEWLVGRLPRPADAVATGLAAAALEGWFMATAGTWTPTDPLTLLVGVAAVGGRLAREPLAARALANGTALEKAP